MGNVSTRPQKTATPVAGTVTAVTKPSTSGNQPAIENKAQDWRPAFVESRDAVCRLLERAEQLDEEERDDACGMAKRLMRLAINTFGQTSNQEPKQEVERAAFDTETLICGVLDLSADKVGPNVEGHLRHALHIIDSLTSTLCGGFDVERIYEAIRTDAAPAASEPTRSMLHQAENEETDADKRMRIAFDANYSIQELAKALKTYHMRDGSDDWPVYCGILSQIQQLAEVVWCAMRLGGADDSMVYPSNETLQHFLDGHFTLIVRDER
ncbi:hypothetical protein ABL840_04895 [Variovorax sp. NFACC27]|uniref:hypothetical protein n=1 Tax=unclassified Variovorax TaxID=663243 RepID=UPI00089D41F0|nr:hypothetical protein SAMN03159371_00114 [Variovorax sp. NFACC28]SEF72651.1 hypothetical protein SAMN03159365_00703 [Variovorax sp. NFACC29]SFB77337.1 hypothetical protein SAMN03159379_00702 [Variovorax sp. NFACC26]SFG76938.1 hypothetical protein SAMN03159447_04825 [Variovorax sp. NFACC27]